MGAFINTEFTNTQTTNKPLAIRSPLFKRWGGGDFFTGTKKTYDAGLSFDLSMPKLSTKLAIEVSMSVESTRCCLLPATSFAPPPPPASDGVRKSLNGSIAEAAPKFMNFFH